MKVLVLMENGCDMEDTDKFMGVFTTLEKLESFLWALAEERYGEYSKEPFVWKLVKEIPFCGIFSYHPNDFKEYYQLDFGYGYYYIEYDLDLN